MMFDSVRMLSIFFLVETFKNVSMCVKLKSLKFSSGKFCHLLTAKRTDVGLKGVASQSHQLLLPAPLYTTAKLAFSGRGCLEL